MLWVCLGCEREVGLLMCSVRNMACMRVGVLHAAVCMRSLLLFLFFQHSIRTRPAAPFFFSSSQWHTPRPAFSFSLICLFVWLSARVTHAVYLGRCAHLLIGALIVIFLFTARLQITFACDGPAIRHG
ncbi:hypothetical protein BDY21DRAFT_331608 [Lineolata rhizophorae]|uniref:Uncharacterized protein n=1 Tax=Lineolata rhizophorae TaxID=578093 RepID=A0A6A6PCX5_9PEZI|nr:hypothetical protein BDY21DRAFT_331608 [Lineolata rhizophorae]